MSVLMNTVSKQEDGKPGPSSHEADLARTLAHLTPIEWFWRYKQLFLQTRGYMLRPRYRHGWQPSWKAWGGYLITPSTEDAVLPSHEHIIDATRVEDGRLVCLKRLESESVEASILSLFSELSMRSDKANHCVPLLETVQDYEDANRCFAVMPYLLPLENPTFEIVEDLLDFIDQTLEGLAFMHKHGVAHRECTSANIMMDAHSLYPKGFHPVNIGWLPDLSAVATPLQRFAVGSPVKYYFVSFKKATRLARQPGPTLVTGLCALDQHVPELEYSEDKPYDPFKVDVYVLGKLYGGYFDRWTNAEFLQPLVLSMTCPNPGERPDAASSLTRWQHIRRRIPTLHRFSRLRSPLQSPIRSFLLDLILFADLCSIVARRFWKRFITVLSGGRAYS